MEAGRTRLDRKKLKNAALAINPGTNWFILSATVVFGLAAALLALDFVRSNRFGGTWCLYLPIFRASLFSEKSMNRGLDVSRKAVY